jgi:hypothetical protein
MPADESDLDPSAINVFQPGNTLGA